MLGEHSVHLRHVTSHCAEQIGQHTHTHWPTLTNTRGHSKHGRMRSPTSYGGHSLAVEEAHHCNALSLKLRHFTAMHQSLRLGLRCEASEHITAYYISRLAL